LLQKSPLFKNIHLNHSKILKNHNLANQAIVGLSTLSTSFQMELGADKNE
jgi:hypothetical protein